MLREQNDTTLTRIIVIWLVEYTHHISSSSLEHLHGLNEYQFVLAHQIKRI